MNRRDMTTDLDTSSRGIPADWEILRDGQPIGAVACPDDHTALILATYRYGSGVTVRRRGAAA